jgi:hypothetical protein
MITFQHQAGHAGHAGESGEVVVFVKMKGRGSERSQLVRRKIIRGDHEGVRTKRRERVLFLFFALLARKINSFYMIFSVIIE